MKKYKINFLGDSITAGVGASAASECFVGKIEKKTGWICRNYGISGSRIAQQNNPAKDETETFFGSRIDSMDNDADIIVIFGGTNDFGHGDAKPGNFTDKTPETFYGALHYMFEKAINKFPDSAIFVLTPLHRVGENGDTGGGIKQKGSPTLKEYADIIKEVAEYYSLPVLDLFAYSGIQPEIQVMRNKYTVDGLHPNDTGHEKICDMIINFIKYNYIDKIL